MKLLHVNEAPTTEPLTHPIDVWNSMKEIGSADQESFWVIGINRANKEVFRELIFLGGYTKILIDTRILFKRLLINGCNDFFLVHNHPSGDCLPSDNDIDLTHYIQKIGFFLNINLIDHIIITHDSFCSLKELEKMLENNEKNSCETI